MVGKQKGEYEHNEQARGALFNPALMHYTIKKRKSQLENIPRATREAPSYHATNQARTYPTAIPGPPVTAVNPALHVYFDIAERSR